MTSPNQTTTTTKLVTSRESELSTPPTTCPYTASSSTSKLTTSSPPMRPSHPTYIDTEINEGSDTEGDDAVDSKYTVQTPLLTHTTFPYTYEKTIVVTSPASETFLYTNTSSLCTIKCDPTHSKSQTTHNPKPSQQILGSTSFNQYHNTQNPEVLRRTREKCYGRICPDASVTYDPTNINLKQSLAQKRFPIQTYFLPVNAHNPSHGRPDSTYNNANDTIATNLAAEYTTSDARQRICNDNGNTISYQASSPAPPPVNDSAYRNNEQTNPIPAPPLDQALAYQQLEQLPLSTQNFQQRLSTAPPSANTVALQTTEQKSSLTSPAGSSSNQTTPQTDRLARFRSPDPDYPQRYPEAQRQRISRSNRNRVSNQLQPENFFHQAYGYIDYINYQLDSQLPVPEKSSSSNYTVSTSSGSTTSISSTTNESYTYNPIIKIFLLVAVLILQVLLLCNSTTTSAEYSKFNNSIELKETFTSFYQQVNQIMRTAKSIQIIASAASDVTIKARIDYDLPHATFANSSSLSIEAIDTLHPSSYGGSDYSNLGISIINNKIPASSVCSASYYEVLRQHLDGLNLSYDD